MDTSLSQGPGNHVTLRLGKRANVHAVFHANGLRSSCLWGRAIGALPTWLSDYLIEESVAHAGLAAISSR